MTSLNLQFRGAFILTPCRAHLRWWKSCSQQINRAHCGIHIVILFSTRTMHAVWTHKASLTSLVHSSSPLGTVCTPRCVFECSKAGAGSRRNWMRWTWVHEEEHGPRSAIVLWENSHPRPIVTRATFLPPEAGNYANESQTRSSENSATVSWRQSWVPIKETTIKIFPKRALTLQGCACSHAALIHRKFETNAVLREILLSNARGPQSTLQQCRIPNLAVRGR